MVLVRHEATRVTGRQRVREVAIVGFESAKYTTSKIVVESRHYSDHAALVEVKVIVEVSSDVVVPVFGYADREIPHTAIGGTRSQD